MNYALLFIPLAIAILDWISIARKLTILGYFTNPGVIATLFIWLWFSAGLQGALIWFALALIFSLAGAVFLMLPRERFVAGYVAFLLAQICYLIGFTSSPAPINLATLALAGLLLAVAMQNFRRISASLAANNLEGMIRPVLIYAVVITLMLLSALLTLVRPEWLPWAALACSMGGLLYYLSDTFLAWNRFVKPIHNGRLIVRILYHCGQILIILGAAIQFGS